MIGKLLTIQADIYNVERIFVVEEGDVRKLASNFIIFVVALCANPICYFVLYVIFCIAFEPNGNTFAVFLN